MVSHSHIRSETSNSVGIGRGGKRLGRECVNGVGATAKRDRVSRDWGRPVSCKEV